MGLKKKLAIGAGALVALVAGYAGYVQATYRRDFSSTPLPAVVQRTQPEVVSNGAYLVHAVAHCSACHGVSARNQLREDRNDLRGGWEIAAGPFGTFYPSNLTSDPETGLGKLTDAQLARAIRYGVSADGHLDPVMSFVVGPMSDFDLTSIVSYLRSLPPLKNEVKKDEWGPLAKVLAGRFGPNLREAAPYSPRGRAGVERGRYLATGPANCAGCHTPSDPLRGFAETGPQFSGEDAGDPDPTDSTMEIVAPNLTSDPTGVLGNFNEDQFVERFRKGGRVHAGSKMPWENFALLDDADLRSIHRYLLTVPPAKHDVGPTRRKKR